MSSLSFTLGNVLNGYSLALSVSIRSKNCVVRLANETKEYFKKESTDSDDVFGEAFVTIDSDAPVTLTFTFADELDLYSFTDVQTIFGRDANSAGYVHNYFIDDRSAMVASGCFLNFAAWPVAIGD